MIPARARAALLSSALGAALCGPAAAGSVSGTIGTGGAAPGNQVSASAALMDESDWTSGRTTARPAGKNDGPSPRDLPSGPGSGDAPPPVGAARADGGLAEPPVAQGRAIGQAAPDDAPGAGTLLVTGPQAAPAGAPAPEAAGSQAQGRGAPPEADAAVKAPAGPDAEAQRAAAALIAAAREKLAAGDFQGALDDLTRASLSDPSGASLARRAEVYNRLARYESARDDALAAIKLDPAAAGAWTQLAFAQLRLGKLGQAAQAVDQAARLSPRSGTIRYVRYLVRGRTGDAAGAADELQTAALLDAKYLPFAERVRSARRFIDPDDESSLGDAAASRPGGRLPGWVWAALGLLAALAAALAAGLVVVGRRREPAVAAASEQARAGGCVVDAQDGRLGGKYERRQLIARGGMGEVYEALDHSLGRPVAIKKLPDRIAGLGADGREQLVREAKTVAALRHPAVVAIYEILEDADDVYLVFELVKGRTAHELLSERGPLPLKTIVEILLPVCQALEYAHTRGVVHRDLKPANVMITDEGHVKLMDFGISRSMGEDAGPEGTPEYMAPELLAGVVSKQGDVFALGVCLYELATGRLPTALPGLRPASAWRRGLPSSLDALVEDCLVADPAQRLASPGEFGRRLAALLAPSAAAAGVATPQPVAIK